MKIQAPDPLRPSNATTTRSTGRAAGGSGFIEELAGSAHRAAAGTAAKGAAATCGPIGLLVAQEVDEAVVRRRQARRRAEALLDRMEDLRRDILLGRIPEWKLAELARLAQSERAAVDDPHLTAILEEIDLRAQVELAKWEAARGQVPGAEE